VALVVLIHMQNGVNQNIGELFFEGR